VLRPEAYPLIAEAVHRVLERQALAGLGTKKDGSPLTLHGESGELWADVTFGADGSVTFNVEYASILEKYGALDLKPEFQAELDTELQPIFEAYLVAEV
jgi:hypothetical protein